MHFNKEALGDGLTVFSNVENGKAIIELTAYLQEAVSEEPQTGKSETEPSKMEVKADDADIEAGYKVVNNLWVEFQILDCEDRVTAIACVPAEEITTVKCLLIYPHLWNGMEDPCLYTVQAMLLCEGRILDEVQTWHAVRTFQTLPIKGFCLNDKPIDIKGIYYTEEDLESRDSNRLTQQMLRDLQSICAIGANTICVGRKVMNQEFFHKCDEMGFIVWKNPDTDSCRDFPELYGNGENALMSPDGRRKRDLYYYYKACWTKEPFVHLCGHEDALREGDMTCVMVYSNQKKVALYVNGILFEFKEGAPEFQFEDIPLKSGSTVISAQSGECYTSMTIQKIYAS